MYNNNNIVFENDLNIFIAVEYAVFMKFLALFLDIQEFYLLLLLEIYVCTYFVSIFCKIQLFYITHA